MSEDSTIAIFKIADLNDDFKDTVTQRLKEATEGDGIEFPQHTLQIRRDLTDGPIPGLSMNCETFELSCDWREMFTIFWSEVRMTSKLTRDWVAEQEVWMNEMKGKIARGQMDVGTMMMRAMNGFATSNQSAAKTARRARIATLRRRKYPEVEKWYVEEQEEERILGDLGRKREIAAMVDLSDDEEEDGEEEEGESEGDGWEDEDDEDEVYSEDGELAVASSRAGCSTI